MAATTGALIASALITAGGAAISSSAQSRSNKRQTAKADELARAEKIAKTKSAEDQRVRERNSRAITEATAAKLRNDRLRTQGISGDAGDLSVSALGDAPTNTASSVLDPTLPGQTRV